MMQQTAHSGPVKIIKAGHSSVGEYAREVWKYRHLISIFAVQEFKVQYTQTRFKFLWVVLKPLMVLALFTFIFDTLIHIPGLVYPYSLFAFSGLIVWNNFSYMVNSAGGAVIANQQLIKKVYFSRIILVFAKMLVSLIEVGVSLILLFILMAILHYPPQWHIFFLPLFILMGLILGTAIAIWLNALTVFYRDLFQFIPTLIGFLIWLTPVFYPVSLITAKYPFIIYFNPIAGAIQGCRWAILGDALPGLLFVPSFIFSLLLLLTGCLVFIRAESDLADYI